MTPDQPPAADAPHVLMLSDTRPDAMRRLQAGFHLHRIDLKAADAGDRLAQVGPLCRGIAADGQQPVDAALLACLPALEIVSCGSAGYDGFDIDAIRARGLRLANTAPALAQEVADMALLLAQAAWKRVVAADAWVRDGDWAAKGAFPLQRGFRGRRLGIVGMGTIGRSIAGLAPALGLQASYWSRSAKDDVALPFQPDLERLAADSDILIVIVPGGDGTRHLIGAPVMRALGPDGLLVNIARGSVVDEQALIKALRSGTLGAAALDVFAREPDPDPKLTALPNVTLSPHQGSGTVETRDAMAAMMVDNLLAHFAGRPLPGAVL